MLGETIQTTSNNMDIEGKEMSVLKANIGQTDGMQLIFDSLLDFPANPTGNVTQDIIFLRDVAKGLLNLCNVVTLNGGNLREEIEDFSLFIRDPVSYQEALDTEFRQKRALREKEKENQRLIKIAEKEVKA